MFDLDGTLIRGTSAERLLVPFLLRRGVLGPRQVAAALTTAVKLPIVGRTAALRRNKRYLVGLDVDAVREHVRDFLSEILESRFNGSVVRRLLELGSGATSFACLRVLRISSLTRCGGASRCGTG